MKSNLSDKIKQDFFQAVAVSEQLYGCTTWTLTKHGEKRLNGNYTRMLCTVLNKSWKKHPTKQLLFIIKGFRTMVFIFIVISTMFRPICPPAFFRCLSNSGTYTDLRTTSFIESTEVAPSDSVNHNRVQVLSIPVLLLGCSQDWTCNH